MSENINQAAGIPAKDAESDSSATGNGHEDPDPECAQFTFGEIGVIIIARHSLTCKSPRLLISRVGHSVAPYAFKGRKLNNYKINRGLN